MAINSLNFIIFIAIVCLVYFVVPKKIKWVILLIANYTFYWICSKKMIVYMLITTISIYLLALWMGKIDSKTKELCKKEQDRALKKKLKNKVKTKKKCIVFLAVLINFGILISLKYCNFIFKN